MNFIERTHKDRSAGLSVSQSVSNDRSEEESGSSSQVVYAIGPSHSYLSKSCHTLPSKVAVMREANSRQARGCSVRAGHSTSKTVSVPTRRSLMAQNLTRCCKHWPAIDDGACPLQRGRRLAMFLFARHDAKPAHLGQSLSPIDYTDRGTRPTSDRAFTIDGASRSFGSNSPSSCSHQSLERAAGALAGGGGNS